VTIEPRGRWLGRAPWGAFIGAGALALITATGAARSSIDVGPNLRPTNGVKSTQPSRATVPSSSCTAAQKGERVAELKRYLAQMMKARRAYFRSHNGAKARRAFLKRQQRKLRKLRRAAACEVLPAGSGIIATVPIPNDGPVAVDSSGIWVVDRANGEVDAAGTPRGALYRVDPATNTVTDQIRGVFGNGSEVGFGAVWIGGAYALNAVLRADIGTRSVTRLPSGPSADEGPGHVAISPGAVWVTNHHAGTLAQLNPVTGAVVRTVEIVGRGTSGPNRMVFDGKFLWVAVPRDNSLVKVDATTAEVVQRLGADRGNCGGLAADSERIWVAGAVCGSTGVLAVDRQTGQQTFINVDGNPWDVAVAFGSLWVATRSPSRLLRIDPATREITGSLDLSATP
jgi:virginiamycin B lyase